MALASTILGGVAAISQPNIKRLLAYSSINNIGFILIGLAAGTREGVASVLFYLAVYIAMTLGAFLCVQRMRDAEGRPVETIASLSGLPRTNPAQIGRASCMERVRMYVYISVVAGSLKKKKNKQNNTH